MAGSCPTLPLQGKVAEIYPRVTLMAQQQLDQVPSTCPVVWTNEVLGHNTEMWGQMLGLVIQDSQIRVSAQDSSFLFVHIWGGSR